MVCRWQWRFQITIMTFESKVKVNYTKNLYYVLYLRNEFNFWNVHGIMNTSGLVQSVNFARDPKYS